MFVALGISRLYFIGRCLVTPIIHSQHDSNYRGLERKYIAGKALIDRTASAAGDPVAANTGSVEVHTHQGEARHGVQLDILVVLILFRDAVAVKDYRIVVLEIESLYAGKRSFWRGDNAYQRIGATVVKEPLFVE